jgi:hypothetical protein
MSVCRSCYAVDGAAVGQLDRQYLCVPNLHEHFSYVRTALDSFSLGDMARAAPGKRMRQRERERERERERVREGEEAC